MELELLSCTWIQTVKHVKANHPNTIGTGNPLIFRSHLGPWCFLRSHGFPVKPQHLIAFSWQSTLTLYLWGQRSHNTMSIAVSVSRKHFFFSRLQENMFKLSRINESLFRLAICSNTVNKRWEIDKLIVWLKSKKTFMLGFFLSIYDKLL